VTVPGQRAGIAILAVTRGGARLGGEVAASLGPAATLHVAARWLTEAPAGAVGIAGPLADRVAALFSNVEALVFVLATGATVRLVAPLLGQKQADPAVICVDEAGRHVVALLGGHQSGANTLTAAIADAIGAEPVISTASDALGLPALDTLGVDHTWKIEASPDTLKRAAAAVVAGQVAATYQDAGSGMPLDELPLDWPRVSSVAELLDWNGPRLLVTDRLVTLPDADPSPDQSLNQSPSIVYRPPTLVLGVGCSLGAPADEIEALARDAIAEAGLAWASVGTVATIDRRATEPGVVALAERLGVPLVTYTAVELAAVDGTPTPSAEVQRHVGTPGVCEPAAILASDGDSGALLVPKRRSAHATVAVARRAEIATPGRLWLVGMGPGPLDLMTGRARQSIRRAGVVIGYRGYLEMLCSLVAARRLRPYELGQERERAREAIALARGGKDVALVSSGDIAIYGMAGLVFELLEDEAAPTEAMATGTAGSAGQLSVEVVPGVTAASSANALLGAPLMLDFAAISLSDLLVPWDTILQRLTGAATGDLVVVLYNPASVRRRQPLTEALAILGAHRPPETPVGLVREAYRPDQSVTLTTLGALVPEQIDMRTVVVIGSSRTATLGDRMVSRRGYQDTREQG
jgi:cobalt-precorrin 5A hydrolase/precorrin-3B C17-methyltransferase